MSKYIIPLFLLFVFSYSLINRKNSHKSFIEGAMDGIKMIFTIYPVLLSMVFASNIFIYSGIIEDLFSFITNIPSEIIIQGVLRPLSGNASLSIMTDIYQKYGVDSKYALYSSVLQGSSDTTIYVISLYFGSVGITKYRYAIILGLICDLIGFITTIVLLNYWI